ETVAMHRFGELLEQMSNGKYKVQVFPNSMLGKEDAYIANTRKGIIQMCATGTQTSSLQASMGMLETPMLFDDYDHAHRAMNGKTFELINAGFPEKSGLRMMNAFPLGFRNFYTKNEVKSINDIKGLRMRVPNIPLYTNFAKECGISGQPMPFAEVPAALDQGVIDGGDSPLADIVADKMYEKCPKITTTRHILVIHALYINEKFYQSLPAQDREWFDKAAKQSAEECWVAVAEVDKKAAQEILDHGGSVSEPTAELKQFMQDAGKRSWQLFLDPQSKNYVPNAQEILDSAASYRNK
ncbi:MAG: TRAP transporter substrate-binding protein, partial [Desulfovibrionaceae bacterium]|nr:TRAP transporter substrate-binding protein [Desulfovibrionaceae bacterium]